MKKQIILVTLLSVLAASTGCNSDVNVAPYPQGNTAAAPVAATAVTGETAIANTETAAQNDAVPQQIQAAAQQTTQAAAQNNTAQQTQAGGGQDNVCINPEFYLFGGYVATQTDDLNMRKFPNTSSEILEKIPNGTQLDIYSCDTVGWYLTIFNNKVGYVSAEFINQIDSYVPTPNEYGFYYESDPPATSVSVAALSGTWINADVTSERLVITSNGLYSGNFNYTDSNGNQTDGYICLEYLLYPGDVKDYYYTFYDYSGCLWHGFGVSGEIPLNDIYADQQGFPHYTRTN